MPIGHAPFPSVVASAIQRVSSAWRHWPASLFVLAASTTLVCLAWLACGKPTPVVTLAATGTVLSATSEGFADAPLQAWTPAARTPVNAGMAKPGSGIPESAWQRQRAEALAIDRINAEMMPLTPGVTADQYASGSDDLGPDAAAASAGVESDDDGNSQDE